jgi:Flp pilus assembly pilin Flp
MFSRLRHDRSGSSLLEYCFLMTITIALVVIGVAATGSWIAGMFERFLAAVTL